MRYCVLLLLITTPICFGDIPSDIERLKKPSADPAVNQASHDRLVKGGPSVLLPLLKAWPTNDPVAANWLRVTFDDIVALPQTQLPVEKLLSFVSDSKYPGKARRVALSAIEKSRPGTTAKLLPTFLNDLEFGPDAVADRILAAENATSPDDSKKLLLEAYSAANQFEQVQLIGKKLSATGEKLDLNTKLGVVTNWNVIGPFDVAPAEGLAKSFPPEDKIDLSAEYPAKAGNIRWIAATAEADGKSDLTKSGITPDRGSVSYATVTIVVPKAITTDIRVSAVDNVTAWVNGKEVVKHASLYRSQFRPDRHRATVSLQAGANTILLKLTRTPAEEGGRPMAPPKWDFMVRFVQGNQHGLSFKTGEAK